MCELQRGAKLLKEIKMENERVGKSSVHLIQAAFKSNVASYAGRKIPSLLCMDDFSRNNSKKEKDAIRKSSLRLYMHRVQSDTVGKNFHTLETKNGEEKK